jgi:aspartyl aminopeptidase
MQQKIGLTYVSENMGYKEYLAIESNGKWKDNLQDGKFCNVHSAQNIVGWIMSNQKIRNKGIDVGYNLNNDHAEYKPI